jgi:hypothetical protein
MCSADVPLALSLALSLAAGLVAGLVEGATQHLAVNRDHALACIGKPAHEALEAVTELIRIEPAKQAAERIVAWQAIFQLEEAAEEWLLGHREGRHMSRALATAKYGAQRDHQQFVKVVQTCIASPPVRQPLPAGEKLVQDSLPGWFCIPLGRIDHARIGQGVIFLSSHFEVRFPCCNASGLFRSQR